MSSLWLLRHGSSHSNEGGSSSDSWQIPLTSTGEAEAREAAKRWSKIVAPKTFRLVTSPMLRARQTAEHIRILHPKVVLEIVDGLREFEPVDFSHLPAMRPDERRPLMEPYWANCDPERIGDGQRAESFACFRRRVELALADLQSSNVEVLAVCHGGVIKMAELLLEGGSSRLNSRAMMRAWIDRGTIQNCGLRHFSFQTDSVTQSVHNIGPTSSG